MTTDEHQASNPYRVLLLGGYGFFGRPLAARLALDPLLHLTICGRDLAAAEALASSLNPRFHARRIDVLAPGLADQIRASGAAVVVHASGPFQNQDYGVAGRWLQCGARGW